MATFLAEAPAIVLHAWPALHLPRGHPLRPRHWRLTARFPQADAPAVRSVRQLVRHVLLPLGRYPPLAVCVEVASRAHSAPRLAKSGASSERSTNHQQ